MTKSVAPPFKARQSPAKSRADQGPPEYSTSTPLARFILETDHSSPVQIGRYRETETRKVSCTGDHRKSA